MIFYIYAYIYKNVNIVYLVIIDNLICTLGTREHSYIVELLLLVFLSR